jgi:hypothetical protein
MGDEISLEAVFVASTPSIPLIHLSLRAIITSFAQITDFSRPHTVFQIAFAFATTTTTPLERILSQPCTVAHPTLVLMKKEEKKRKAR